MGFHIEDHRLREVPYVPAADTGGRYKAPPDMIVLHYTASGAAEGSVHWLSAQDQNYVSAHLVVGRDGAVTQLVPFDTIAYHAGVSEWQGRKWLNNYAIGIEIVNWGLLRVDDPQDGSMRFESYTGAEVPSSDAEYATHKYGTPSGYWQRYTEAQINSVLGLCQTLFTTYPSIRTIVGHDDIAPGRKSDPGPLFPMTTVRRIVEQGVCSAPDCTNALEAISDSIQALTAAHRALQNVFNPPRT